MLANTRALGRLLLASKTTSKPATSAPCLQAQSKRYRRACRMIFREKLPRYKRDLFKLPPLTSHLVIKQSEDAVRVPPLGSLDQLWAEKMEVFKAYLPLDQKPILLEALFNPANDIDKLLCIIDENLVTMTSFYVAASFEALDDMMRFGQSDINTVIVSPEFRRLCSRAMYKIRFFESDEVLKLLKCLTTIRLPDDMLISQAALQMARHLINDYNMDELHTLSACLDAFAISDSSKKSLLLALKEAIPVVRRNLIEEKRYDQLEASKSPVSKEQEQ